MKKQINIIPTDAPDNYRDALGYAWQEYVMDPKTYKADKSKSVPGDDRRGGFREYQQAVLDLESQGITCIDAKNCGRLPEGSIVVVRVDCLWCGGASIIGYILPQGVEAAVVVAQIATENPGEESHETGVIVAGQERLEEMELDARNAHHSGWCTKCHSFCYGDCQA